MIKFAEISAPAKTILCGQHAVVYGEDAIAFAVDLNCHAQIYAKSQGIYQSNSIALTINISNQSKQVRFNSQVLSITESLDKKVTQTQFQQFTINQVEFSFEDFSQKMKSVFDIKDPIELNSLYKITLFCSIFSINLANLSSFLNNMNFTIQTSSQIPIGKGLGSSASFNSVLAASLLIITRILPQQSIQNHFQFKALVNYLSQLFQKVQHGKPSGIDNFVSIYGGMVLFNRTKTPTFKIIQNPKILSFLSSNFTIGFVDSGIQKNTKLAVSNVLQKYNLHLSGQNQYKNLIQQIGRFPDQIITLLSNSQNQQYTINKLFQILKQNHSYLRELGLSNQEIEEIVDKYTVQDKSVAKITGAGMGGVVLIISQKQFLSQAQSTQTRHCLSSKMNTQGLRIKFF